ncbi:aminomethyltransferase, mitochondrial-like [Daphnia pulex]|uniref:aminomethyltransferase, mitochondrial-like n=1 Tax=Daphnia pulex TaxID=6669 RepID=UPI001EE13865|nr:aminomethyltransferase, mitochondrial-like [Daphnia pulex]
MLKIARQYNNTLKFTPLICRSFSSENAPKKTCLYDLNVKYQGKMVDFAGYLMPVQYGAEGIQASHKHTRSHCSLFDVSHMLQSNIHGKDNVKFLESLMVGDIQSLPNNHGTLSVFTTDSGGIIDDFIVNKTSLGYLYVVSNAGCRDQDLALLNSKLALAKKEGLDVDIEVLEERGLLAIQGPLMMSILQPHVDIPLDQLYFMTTSVATVCGVQNCRITRCGYTGEDGVEVSVPPSAAADIVDKLLESSKGALKLAGLGARDSLRLEAGLCLYGNDMDETINPIEASLAWLVAKRRRTAADFPGAANILAELKSTTGRRRVGFVSRGPPARGHTPIYSKDGNLIGEITSGCPSPSLPGVNVSMGHLDRQYVKSGTQVQFEIRKKMVDAQVTKMPFVPTKYYIKK